MAHTDDDPVKAAGRRREAAWKALDKVHRNPPDCEHLATLNTPDECEHLRAWRARIAAAHAAYGEAIRECDQVARECFVSPLEAAGRPV
jgi:hypothetical protein